MIPKFIIDSKTIFVIIFPEIRYPFLKIVSLFRAKFNALQLATGLITSYRNSEKCIEKINDKL